MIQGVSSGKLLEQAADIENQSLEEQFESEKSSETESFSELLSDAINGVDGAMKTSNAKVQDFVAGKNNNVSDVMISMQRAKLSFDLMVEVRNKVVDAYQEVSRMQI